MSSPNKTVFGHVKDLGSQAKEMFSTYKQMTPTKDQSNFQTLKYMFQNRNHTYHAFGIDTGIKDYGAQILRNPLLAMRMKNTINNFQNTGQSMVKRITNTMNEINENPVTKHGFHDW